MSEIADNKRERAEVLFDAITDIRDDFIEEAQTAVIRPVSFKWQKWSAAAACLVLAIGIGLAWGGINRFSAGEDGGSIAGGIGAPQAGNGTTSNADTGGAYSVGTNGSDVKQINYAGPVLPLTLEDSEAANKLAVERSISYDLVNADKNPGANSGIAVKDEYTIKNTSDEEKTINLLYPYVSNLKSMTKSAPAISIEGKAVNFFVNIGEDTTVKKSVNGKDDVLTQAKASSLEDYSKLLQNGEYQDDALMKSALDSQLQVTIYELVKNKNAIDGQNDMIQSISFVIDPKKTAVLACGFTGNMTNDGGLTEYSFNTSGDNTNGIGTKLLIVFGEDIGEYTLNTASADEAVKETGDSAYAVKRYTGSYYEVVERLIQEFGDQYIKAGENLLSGYSNSIAKLIDKLLFKDGVPSEDVSSINSIDIIEKLIGQAYIADRVFYLEAPVTIPAGESVSLSVSYVKDSSFEYAGGEDTERTLLYDMSAELGSCISFESITAELINFEDITITDQNYGFDLSGSRSEVTLNPLEERYYIIIKEKE